MERVISRKDTLRGVEDYLGAQQPNLRAEEGFIQILGGVTQ